MEGWDDRRMERGGRKLNVSKLETKLDEPEPEPELERE